MRFLTEPHSSWLRSQFPIRKPSRFCHPICLTGISLASNRRWLSWPTSSPEHYALPRSGRSEDRKGEGMLQDRASSPFRARLVALPGCRVIAESVRRASGHPSRGIIAQTAIPFSTALRTISRTRPHPGFGKRVSASSRWQSSAMVLERWSATISPTPSKSVMALACRGMPPSP